MLADLTREQLAEVAATSVLVMPFGAVEQHGPHLPFGTDSLIVDAVAHHATERAGRDATVVCAPTMVYGSSEHHVDVGGALSLGADTFEACARDLFASAAASGFRRVFVVNGHGGNDQLLRVAAQVAVGGRQLVVGGGSYWSLARMELERVLPPGSTIPGHAGRFETSMMLALRPDRDLTAPTRAQWQASDETAYWREDRRWWKTIDGYTDSPGEGTAEDGAACFEAIATAVAASIVEFERSTREPVAR